ncbi:MAG: TMEM175 family protein [Acidimicrobiia bacterium]
MSSDRLKAFSDGVIAILITIMVLELRPPEGSTLSALEDLVPVFWTYVLSFVFIAIYWNNHHHLLAVVERIDGAVLWANMHLLLWLSFTPFVTAWMGEHPRQATPVSVYGVVLFGSGVAYFILVRALLHIHDVGSTLAQAIGTDRKGVLSMLAYLAAIPLSIVEPMAGIALYIVVAVVWLVPDRRITRALGGAS